MCGIVGMVEIGSSAARYAVASALDSLCHRGPDDGGVWATQVSNITVAVGHRRLSIIDLTAAGAQPMLGGEDGPFHPALSVDDPASFALVYNGEIYNYVELRDELRRGGHIFSSSGDTEVLLAAYARWGEECLDRLNGMFAFALWDRRRRRLVCARDRFGEKPFYYALGEGGQRFAFASEVKALVAAGAVSPELDSRAVYRFFRFGEQAGVAATVWRGVRRLLPGEMLIVDTSGPRLVVRARRYWDVPVGDSEPSADTLAHAATRFAELFADSVRIRLRSDVPVGTSLSGGLDSSSVLCQIHTLGAASSQKAFTARMEEKALDEGYYVDLVLAHTGVSGHSVVPTAREFLGELDRLAFHQEEPFTSTSVFASYLVHRLAKAHGVTVMLDGQGADEYLAGYSHYIPFLLASLARRGKWLAWRRERKGAREVVGVDPVPFRAALRYRGRGLVNRTGSSQVLVDDEHDISFLGDSLRAEFAAEEARTIAITGDPFKGRLYADLMHGHLQELLRYADRNSMAFSREVRLPFLDHRLVEFSFSLPSRMLLGDGWSKRVLRLAMQGIVPQEILARRDKIGFAVPWAEWWNDKLVARTLRDRLLDAREDLGELIAVDAVPDGSQAALGVLSMAASLRQLRSLATEAAAVR